MKSQKHVIIVGAGIAGLMTAYYLNREGVAVTVLDKGDGTDNCSYGNAGMIVPSHVVPLASPGMISKGLKWMLDAESPFYIRPRFDLDLFRWGWQFKKASTKKHVEQAAPFLGNLLMKNRELMLALEKREKIGFDFQKKGLFMFCNTKPGLEEEVEAAHLARKVGIPAEILTPDEVRDMEPNLELDIIGATFYPKDAHLHPGLLMDSLKKVLDGRGVTFHHYSQVIEIVDGKDVCKCVVTKDSRRFHGSHFVIAAGAGSQSMIRKLGVEMPIQPGKGYSITQNDPKFLPQSCGIFSEAKVTMTPMAGSLRFAGTMEISGMDKSVNPRKLAGLKKSVVSYLRNIELDELQNDQIWVGLRPISPDGLPYIGAVNKYKNIYTASGFAMMGMSLGAVGGKIITDLVLNNESDFNDPMIDPNRYS